MVLNLDKCIGCHTCSVTCKNVWTSRKGLEYVWWNNVETKPGPGYPKTCKGGKTKCVEVSGEKNVGKAFVYGGLREIEGVRDCPDQM